MHLGWRGALGLLVAAWLTTARAAPEVTYLFPGGAQRGQSVPVNAGGTFSQWPVNVWVDRPGVTFAPQEKRGEFSVSVAADASAGVYWVRLYDPTGAAAPRPFVVGTIRELNEVEPNNSRTQAQSTAGDTAAVLVNGQLGRGEDVDLFKVPVRAGQTLVADFDGQTPLGSPVDGILQLVSPEGFVTAQSEDQQGLDPRLVVPIDRDGEWGVRVFGFPAAPNQSIELAGDANYVYRLTITTGPFVDFTIPLSVTAGALRELTLHGSNLPPELATLKVTAPPAPGELRLEHASLANTLGIPATLEPSFAEQELSGTPPQVELPASITGLIAEPRGQDRYSFAVHPGEIIVARVASRALGFELDPVLELFDAEGKSLARVDDSAGTRDAELAHTATAEGPLAVVVSDLHKQGGPRYAYRLSLERGIPDFRLSTAAHQVVLAPGGAVELPVAIERRHGHAEPITIVPAELPEGVTCAEVVSTAGGDTAAKVTLKFTASAEAAPRSLPLRILGRDPAGRSQPARLSTIPSAELYDLWLTVGAPPAK